MIEARPELGVALQEAMRSALLADGDIARLIGTRIYDRVPVKRSEPDEVIFPYVVIGDDEITEDENSCVASSSIRSAVHVWSNRPGQIEAKLIGGYVRRACGREIPIDGHDTVVGTFELWTYRPGPGSQSHLTEGVILFTYLVDPL